jgi:glycine/D-amino acid oxidase-like deaminating enzyme
MTDAVLQTGLSVAAVDRRGFVRGSTPASTALLQFEIDKPLTLLSKQIGRDRAARVYWRSANAVEYLGARVTDLGLACSFRERHALYLPGNVLSVAALKREVEARKAIGLRSEFIDRKTVFKLAGIDKTSASWSSGAAEVDPARMAAALWRSAAKRGAKIFAPVDVVDIELHRNHVTLNTRAGIEIRARNVVFATGYELVKGIKPKSHKVSATWVIATRPQPKRLWKSRCLIWQAADPYLYIRTTPDGRVMAGGEDDDFSDEEKRDKLIPAKSARIARKLGTLLPAIDATPALTWAACFGDSATGLPTIGPIPGLKHCYAVLGFGGNGITFSAVAAQIIQRALAGVKDPDAELFAFS